MLVAIMTRIRYLGGGLGRMPSVRRTTRFMKPRGFFRPEISVSRAWRVPIPPPPPMPAMILSRTRRGASGPVLSAWARVWWKRKEAVSWCR